MNIPNRTLFVADNLRVLRGIDSESIDLIATDPPFNSKRSFNAPLGSRAAKQKFDDRWQWDEVTDEWNDVIAVDHPAIKELIEAAITIEGGTINYNGSVETKVDNSIAAFIAWMAPRAVEMHRVLKPTGSLYLHSDPAANSYLRLLLDAIFGRKNFRSEIVWRRSNSHNKLTQQFGPIHDTILFYSKSNKLTFHSGTRPYSKGYIEKRFKYADTRGLYQLNYLTGPDTRNGESGKAWGGFDPTQAGRHWAIPRSLRQFLPEDSSGMTSTQMLDHLLDENVIVFPKKDGGQPMYKQYVGKGVPYQDIWAYQPNTKGVLYNSNEHIDEDVKWLENEPEKTKWRTQKPTGLYARMILTSSNPHELVLDPFCGCATTCVAAEQLQRRWIGIDIDPVAEDITKDRLRAEAGLFEQDGNPVTVRKSPPKRTDIPTISDEKLRLALWNNQGHRCGNPYCDSTELRVVDLHLDHRIPKIRGGEDGVLNRVGLCQNCNSRKWSKAWGVFLNEERAKQPHPKGPVISG